MNHHYRVLFLMLFTLFLPACNALSQTLPSQGALQGTPFPSITIPTPSATATIQSNHPCPVAIGTPMTSLQPSRDELPTVVLQYLNSGGEIETLYAVLEESGMATMVPPGWVEKDFTGDGFYDIAIILIHPEPELMLTQGTWIFLQCQRDHYETAYQSPELMDWGAPEIISSEDLTGDQIPDLLIGHPSCGAHTCFTQLEVFIWNGVTMENRLKGTSEDMPSPSIEADPESREIAVIAEGVGSVGAGPYRRFLRQWTWDQGEQAFLPSPDFILPSNFRIHTLHDAGQAAEDGDYRQAMDLYTRVIEDDELLDYMDPAIERPQLAAYASFRRMLTYLLMDNIAEAEAAYAMIMVDYPANSPASDFARMADAFWSEYQSTAEISSACLAAQAFADSHQETILEALYYGYANPTYESKDICPFTN